MEPVDPAQYPSALSVLLFLGVLVEVEPGGWTRVSAFCGRGPKVERQFSSIAQSCLALCDPMDRSTPGLPVHHHLLEFTQTHASVMPSNHLVLCRPLLLLSSILPSIRVFSNEAREKEIAILNKG